MAESWDIINGTDTGLSSVSKINNNLSNLQSNSSSISNPMNGDQPFSGQIFVQPYHLYSILRANTPILVDRLQNTEHFTDTVLERKTIFNVSPITPQGLTNGPDPETFFSGSTADQNLYLWDLEAQTVTSLGSMGIDVVDLAYNWNPQLAYWGRENVNASSQDEADILYVTDGTSLYKIVDPMSSATAVLIGAHGGSYDIKGMEWSLSGSKTLRNATLWAISSPPGTVNYLGVIYPSNGTFAAGSPPMNLWASVNLEGLAVNRYEGNETKKNPDVPSGMLYTVMVQSDPRILWKVQILDLINPPGTTVAALSSIFDGPNWSGGLSFRRTGGKISFRNEDNNWWIPMMSLINGGGYVLRDGSTPLTGDIDMSTSVGASRSLINVGDPGQFNHAINMKTFNNFKIEVGSYEGNGVSGRRILLSTPLLDIGALEVVDSASAATTPTFVKTASMDEDWISPGSTAISASERSGHVLSLGIGFFTLGDDIDGNAIANTTGRSYNYIAYPKWADEIGA